MTLATMLIHSVVILKPGERVSRAGDRTIDWNNPTRTASRAWFSPRRSFEPGDQLQDLGVGEYTFFFDARTDIKNEDRIEWSGRIFEVIGPPREQWTPRGEHHLEVLAKDFEQVGP